MNKCGWNWFGENMTLDGPSFEERKAEEDKAFRAREREERRHALRQMFGEGMTDEEVENLMDQVDDNPNLNYMLLNYLMYGQDEEDDDEGGGGGEDDDEEWSMDDDDEGEFFDEEDEADSSHEADDSSDDSDDFEEAEGAEETPMEDEPADVDEDE
jgi:hypothetical protein